MDGARGGRPQSGIDLLFDTYYTLQYLDAVRRVPSIIRAKVESLDLMDLRAGQRVLDVGCGTGEDVWSLAERVGPGGYAEGVDANPWMIGEAIRRARSTAGVVALKFTPGDVYELPFETGRFDAARAERMFIHLTDPVAALREMSRVVRPGGCVAVGDASFDTLTLAGPALPLTTLVCRRALERYANGAIGGRLSEHFLKFGLEDVTVVSTEIAAETVAEAETLFTLAQASDDLIQAGLASVEDVATWNAELQAREQRGELRWSIVAHLVRGRVPDRPSATR